MPNGVPFTRKTWRRSGLHIDAATKQYDGYKSPGHSSE